MKELFDPVHIHLFLNHFPAIGTLFGVILLAFGFIKKSDTTTKVGLVTFILIGIITIPVFLTGEPAEEAVEHLAGVSESIIEHHEEGAEFGIWTMCFLGVISLITMIRFSKGKILQYITFIVSLFVLGQMFVINNSGGEIRHSEIRSEGAGIDGGSSDDSTEDSSDDSTEDSSDDGGSEIISDDDSAEDSSDDGGSEISGDNGGSVISSDNGGSVISSDNGGNEISSDDEGSEISSDDEGSESSSDDEVSEISSDDEGSESSSDDE